jgi:hypothetical protein
MNLKKLYIISLAGWAMLCFGIGWISLLEILNLPLTELTAIALAITFVGLGIVVKTLSTVKKIEVLIEDIE